MAQQKIRASAHIATIAEGQTVYHTLRWCNRIRREFWFTLDPHAVDGEARANIDNERGAMDNHFDARELPEKYRSDGGPINWITRALQDGFDVDSITMKNRPPPKEYVASGLVVPPLKGTTS